MTADRPTHGLGHLAVIREAPVPAGIRGARYYAWRAAVSKDLIHAKSVALVLGETLAGVAAASRSDRRPETTPPALTGGDGAPCDPRHAGGNALSPVP